MKRISLVFFGLIMALTVFGQTQKTFIKSFTNTERVVALNLDGEVEVKEWSEPFVRVHTNVTLENANSNVLKIFLVQGRYNLSQSTEGGVLHITSAARSENVKYRGQILDETVTYTVYVPQYTQIEGQEEPQQVSEISSKR